MRAMRAKDGPALPSQTTIDEAFMEPRGCNRWQPVASRSEVAPQCPLTDPIGFASTGNGSSRADPHEASGSPAGTR
jgi:hypothetical protein